MGVQLRERAETAQPQFLGLPKKCSRVAEEALSSLSARSRAEKQRTGRQGWMQLGSEQREDTSAPAPCETEDTPCQMHAVTIKTPGRNPRTTEPGPQLLQ